MAVNFQIDKEKRLISGKITGAVDSDDILQIVEDMTKHPDYQPTYNEIWDLRKLDDFKSFFGQVRQRVETEKAKRRLKKPNKDAIVVTNPAHYGIVRQYAVLAEAIPLDVRIFYDYKEALEWVMEE